jgi:hypothetical protein
MTILRETLILGKSEAGMVLSTGLVSWARLGVLVVAVVFFVLSLSSSLAYDPGFRLIVIALAVFMCVVVGPRTEVMIIRSERRIRVTRRFFVFSRAKEYDLNGKEELVISKDAILLKKDALSLPLARFRKAGQREAHFAEIRQCLESMRTG